MANQKISEDSLITGANVAVDNDYLPIVDVSEAQAGDRNKRVLVKELIANSASFLQSGAGAVAESVQAALRRLVFSGQYSSAANFNTARNALTDTVGVRQLSISGASGNAGIVARGQFTFNGTIDPNVILGYNIDETGGTITDAADTAMMLEFETNYNDGVARQAEIHFDIAGPGQSFVRPFAVQYMLTGASANKINDTALQSWNTISLTCNEISLKDRTGVGSVSIAATTNSYLTISTPRFVVAGVGPHAIGGAVNAAVFLYLTGPFTGSSVSYGTYMDSSLTPAVNSDSAGVVLGPTLNKGGSGTHADFSTLLALAPVIGAGAATLTNATTVKIVGAPAAGTNPRALWLTSGLTQLAGALVVDTTAGNAIGAAASSTTTLNLKDSSTGASSLRIPHGTAPSSPVNGDIWTTTGGLFVRINGSTVGPLT